ncbi:MAG: alpha/beta hydrolase [Pseudomonadota bacterium]
MPKILKTPSGRKIAYHRSQGSGSGVVFLGGFMSDMDGTKAVHLEGWCRAQGRAFLRFDYSGHGQSSERFIDGCIGDWAEDAYQAITHLTKGPQLLVGSSMGGWISLLMAKRIPDRMAGLVTIAAAPDFTEDGFGATFDRDTRAVLQETGVVDVPSDYGAPYPITQRLIKDGRDHLVLRAPLHLPCPTRFLQGDCDADVSVETANRLFAHVTGDNVQLTMVKGADHRFSDDRCLRLTETAISEILLA